MQAELVNQLLKTGKLEQAQAQLQSLISAAIEVQVDVRGEIGNLSHLLDPVDGFLESLRHFTAAFQKSNRIAVDLALPEDQLTVSLPGDSRGAAAAHRAGSFRQYPQVCPGKTCPGILENRSILYRAQHRRR
jgi:hypothetical protein